MLVVLQP